MSVSPSLTFPALYLKARTLILLGSALSSPFARKTRRAMDEKLRTDSPDYVQEVGSSRPLKPQAREPYDAAVSFEEYHFYANKTREEQLTLEAPHWNVLQLFRKKSQLDAQDDLPVTTLTEADFRNPEKRLQITDEEWTNASRAFRSASAGACKHESWSALELLIFTGDLNRLLPHYD